MSFSQFYIKILSEKQDLDRYPVSLVFGSMSLFDIHILEY